MPPKYITLSRPGSGHEPDAKRRFFQPRHTYITGLRQALQPKPMIGLKIHALNAARYGKLNIRNLVRITESATPWMQCKAGLHWHLEPHCRLTGLGFSWNPRSSPEDCPGRRTLRDSAGDGDRGANIRSGSSDVSNARLAAQVAVAF